MSVKHTKEIWKWVVGYKGIYKVSSYGKVKLVVDLIYCFEQGGKGGTVRVKRKLFKKGLVKPYLSHGYPAVILRTEWTRSEFTIHRLMLSTFVSPCPEGMEACHKNDIKTDNRLENLEWNTHQQNCQDAFTNGNNHTRKITWEDVQQIRKFWEKSERKRGLRVIHKLSIKFNCSEQSIRNVIKHKLRFAD